MISRILLIISGVFMRFAILMLIFLFPLASHADIKLYVCKKGDETILESTASKGCDSRTEYRYKSTANQKTSPIPSERIHGRNDTYSEIRHDIGSYIRQDNCSLYTALLDDALSYLKVKKDQLIEIGPLKQAELRNQISFAKRQTSYYCS